MRGVVTHLTQRTLYCLCTVPSLNAMHIFYFLLRYNIPYAKKNLLQSTISFTSCVFMPLYTRIEEFQSTVFGTQGSSPTPALISLTFFR